uniref:Uncharacterized protein n=1 Tax=Arundo donax TaxID=35708 RepID=A0A0A9FAL0_ARUDO
MRCMMSSWRTDSINVMCTKF